MRFGICATGLDSEWRVMSACCFVRPNDVLVYMNAFEHTAGRLSFVRVAPDGPEKLSIVNDHPDERHSRPFNGTTRMLKTSPIQAPIQIPSAAA